MAMLVKEINIEAYRIKEMMERREESQTARFIVPVVSDHHCRKKSA